jgi:outer membrane protease
MVKREWMIGALGLSLKAGILNRYLIQKKFELENVALDDVRFNSRTTSFRERPNSKLTKNYTAHYLVGVGVAYAIQPNLSIYVEPTFSKSIQPLINIGSGSLYQESKTLQVGIRYHL